MEIEQIRTLHQIHAKPDFGTTTPEELLFLSKLIHQHKPERILEIGTASGVTTGFLGLFLAEIGGGSVLSIDIAPQMEFQSGAKMHTGAMAGRLCMDESVEITLETGRTSLDLGRYGTSWDLVFIDANHGHPWPVLDTLAAAPFLRGPKVIVHHDLQLWRRFPQFHGAGPRMLFNEVPEAFRHADPANGWNVFMMDMTMPREVFEEVVAGALFMPWSRYADVDPVVLRRFEALIGEHYGAALREAFKAASDVHAPSSLGRLDRKLRKAVFPLAKAIGLR